MDGKFVSWWMGLWNLRINFVDRSNSLSLCMDLETPSKEKIN